MDKPWKPKVYEKFFVVDSVTMKVGRGDDFAEIEQRAAIRAGNYFQTRAGAKTALDAIKKYFKGEADL